MVIIMALGTAHSASLTNPSKLAITQQFSTTELTGYMNYPESVKKLIVKSISLTQKNLTYIYGSSDPVHGGMDCSGTIYYLLSGNTNTEIPRQANEMYTWVKNSGNMHTVTNNDIHSTQFSALKPGDLLFWSGTYATTRKPAITHVMLYLGLNKHNEPLMFGSSDGRTYEGKKMRGVSVFDFRMPNLDSTAFFVGYGCIPSITCLSN